MHSAMRADGRFDSGRHVRVSIRDAQVASHRGRWICRALLLLCFVLLSSALAATPPSSVEDKRRLGPMPEPVLGESVTDIDGTRAGELEIDLTALGGHLDGDSSWGGGVAIEMRVLDWLGLEAEVGYSHGRAAGRLERELELRLLGSVSLFHDFERGLHGQVEVGARLVGERDLGPNFGEPAAPLSGGFRLGYDQRWWTLRVGVGVATAGESVHQIPAWMSATGFVNFGRDRWLSFGLDAEADWTRANPFTVAPMFLLDGRLLHWPGRLALVAPYGCPGGGSERWIGLAVRLIGEFDLSGDD